MPVMRSQTQRLEHVTYSENDFVTYLASDLFREMAVTTGSGM